MSSHHTHSLVRNPDGTDTEIVSFFLGKLERKYFEQCVASFCDQNAIKHELAEDKHVFSVEATFTITGSGEQLLYLKDYTNTLMHQADAIDAGAIPFGSR